VTTNYEEAEKAAEGILNLLHVGNTMSHRILWAAYNELTTYMADLDDPRSTECIECNR